MNDMTDIDSKDLSVLYVEDDFIARKMMNNFLKRYFENITLAENGEDGLSEFKKCKYDIVITDIQMPVMNGLDMTKEIKEINKDQKIIVVTAFSDSAYLREGIELGIDGFIIKPVVNDQLKMVLYKVVSAVKEKKENIKYKQNLEKLVMERTAQLVAQYNELEYKTDELNQQLITDKLTGLYNQKMLTDDIENMKNGVLLLLNIDNFDDVNSTYGYRIGDEALKKIAVILKNIKPKNYRVYRLISDEFAFLGEDVELKDAEVFAKKINDTMYKSTIEVDDIELSFSFSIGIDESKNSDMLKNTHIAMKEIRQVGKNRHFIYSSSSLKMEEKQHNNIEWMRRVKNALQNDAIVPYFQPIVNNKNRKIEKYECLARLKYLNEVITPDFFIGPALKVGLMPNITRMMIDKSSYIFKDSDYEFSLNITENDFKDGYLVDYLKQKIKMCKNLQSRAILEVMEHISVDSSSVIIEQLQELERLGFRIALDDFGSEKSNFSRLQALKVDFIKIDGSFIKDIDSDENSYKIANTINALAKSMNAKVIAEFVHSQSVQKKILELDIEYSQGYFFGEPKPIIL